MDWLRHRGREALNNDSRALVDLPDARSAVVAQIGVVVSCGGFLLRDDARAAI